MYGYLYSYFVFSESLSFAFTVSHDTRHPVAITTAATTATSPRLSSTG